MIRPQRLGALAASLGAELHGDASILIHGVAELADAGPGLVAPLTDPARLEEARRSGASALLVPRPVDLPGKNLLVCSDARRALGKLLELLAPQPAVGSHGVDPRAAVAPTAAIAPTAWIGPFAYVGACAVVGEESRIEPFAYVGDEARVGQRCRLGPGAVLTAGCVLADHVSLGPGAVVGGDGFGFYRDPDGWHRLRSIGHVVIEDGVEIGANSCVDRGTLSATRIGPGVKIDNLVQVGHNVAIGPHSLLCAQVGLAGSVRIEEECVLGGQAGVADHRRIGARARLAAKSGVVQDVPAGAEVAGYPAIPHRRWLRVSALLSRLGDLFHEVRALSHQVQDSSRRLEALLLQVGELVAPKQR